MRSRWSFLVLVPLAFSLAACGRLAVPPVPKGKPVELSLSRAAVTWTDKKGGTLELKPDGTITATHVCSDYDIIDGTDEPRSGSGTWRNESGLAGQAGTVIHVDFETSQGEVTSSYDALQNGRTLKLWTYVGDPDEGSPLCILAAPAG
ncbi:hypothetical protein OHB07_38195 [Streptomyces sp. NBC_00111]|uniref:hypothetical protein n=1 Tax=unclassified Streptomyces TaxID=2593676 RepID=UPI002E34966B|nr:hypothetical protein [Streptomyces sp. NBC_01460]